MRSVILTIYVGSIMAMHKFSLIHYNQGHLPKLVISLNPFWICPLHILEIKTEVSCFSTINPTHGIKAYFMNVLMSISNEDHGLFTHQKFDKRRDLPLSYTQYIKFNSNRPIKQAYNIIISHTIPILYLSSDMMLAKQEISKLISTLVGNGFQKSKLLLLVIITMSKINYSVVTFEVKDLAAALQGMITSNLCIDM